MLKGFRLNSLSSLKPNSLIARNGRSTSLFGHKFTPVSDSSKPFSTQIATTVPVKTMIFMDGTWMYYSLFQGRVEDSRCPIARKFGDSWQKTHQVEWSAIPQIVARNLRQQLNARKLNDVSPVVDITRCNVFTSQRADTLPNSPRDKMLSEFYKNNFSVHRYVTASHQEKCVDISLAVEMLYMATVPNAYEIACIITGDKDFIPAMQKTRLMGKRVALCSMRNGCNADLVAEQAQLRDFEVIYLDEYLDEIVVPKAKPQDGSKTKELLQTFVEILSKDRTSDKPYSARDLGRELQTLRIENTVALTVLKEEYLSVRSFIDHFPQLFAVLKGKTKTDFGVQLQPGYKEELQNVYGKLADSAVDCRVEDGGEESTVDIEQGKQYRNTLLDANATHTDTLSARSKRSMSQNYDYSIGSSSSASTTCSAEETSSAVSAGSVRKERASAVKNIPTGEIPRIEEAVVGHVVHYLKTCSEVEANSRDLGRYLLTVPHPGYENALAALKSASGRLIKLLQAHKELFVVGQKPAEGNSYALRLVEGGAEDDGVDGGSGIDGGCYGSYSSDSTGVYGSGDANGGSDVDGVDDTPARVETTSVAADTTSPRDATPFKSLKVANLREALQARGLPTDGKKSELIQRLVVAAAAN